jgi:hypothetical protein
MSWNYRVVKFNGGEENFDEPYYEVKEVYYNSDGSLMGYCDATVSSDTFEGLIEVLDQMKADAHRIIIDEEEFFREDTKREEFD